MDSVVAVLPLTQSIEQSSRIATQLLEASANNLAIEDTLYQLSRAFNSNVTTDVAVYMRQVRRLANEQFLRRVLIAKIR